ncbi:MAG: isoaspartyl peptidase/L-asparaginase [Novosphingobium sp.]|nr:isoaspartyl peptidase/L-asparaginase [Novosphingobium sp.]MBO9601554.1 isoaspartyl peptidase/L-asparaginase [Novosphingobium sp.]
MAKRFGQLLLALALSLAGLTPAAAKDPSYKHYAIGDLAAPTTGAHGGGMLLMGGGDWDYDALRWFFRHAGNGHIVVLRASYGGEDGEEFYDKIGGILSAETFVFSDRKAASDPKVLAALRKADGIFIAGGDQSNYVRFWKGTEVAKILDAHVAAGKPIAGTSAGLAMLGEALYGAMDGGSVTSPEALADPFGPAVTIEKDFLHLPLLARAITDTHFKERERQGRLMAFLAKAQAGDPPDARPMIGVAVDQAASLAVEPDGTARLYTELPDGSAWIFDGSSLRGLKSGGPLYAPRVKVVGVGPNSVLHLPDGTVDNPLFTRYYSAMDGKLSEVPRWSLAIHGGAGVIERGAMTPDKERAYRAGLNDALAAGAAVLDKGGTSLDAVQATVRVLEDNPLFNAGKGAVFDAEGRNQLDAAIMDGKTQRAGAVAALTSTRNPIDAARAVMDHSRHVLLTGPGADAFAKQQGVVQVDPSYFRTDERWNSFLEWKKDHTAGIDPTHMYGTVGAVAVDADGNLAAATSTGGLTGKQWGRIGDSPLIGAGTYAKNGACAVSATGTGEFFIRDSAARQVCDRVAWKGQTLADAAHDTIMSVGALGGDGGLIAMGPAGRPAFAINDIGMYRGSVSSDRPAQTAIYPDEKIGE